MKKGGARPRKRTVEMRELGDFYKKLDDESSHLPTPQMLEGGEASESSNEMQIEDYLENSA